MGPFPRGSQAVRGGVGYVIIGAAWPAVKYLAETEAL